MKVIIQFKDPDAIHEIMDGHHPLPQDWEDRTPRMITEREEFSDKYFEFGDYGRIEIDTATLQARLLPRAEWK